MYVGTAVEQQKAAKTRQKDTSRTMVTMRMPLAAAAALGGIALHFI